MPSGIFERTEEHSEKCRENGRKQLGKLPVNSKYKTGMKVGYLTLLERTPIGEKPIIWKCKCVCGTIVNKTSVALVHKETYKHCGCKKEKGRPHNFKGYEDITGSYWGRIKRQAKERNISFDVTIEDCWKLFLKQNKKCALSDLPIYFSGEKNGVASLDRIDSNKGYTMDNVQWVHKDINKMKNNLSEERFIELCECVVKN